MHCPLRLPGYLAIIKLEFTVQQLWRADLDLSSQTDLAAADGTQKRQQAAQPILTCQGYRLAEQRCPR